MTDGDSAGRADIDRWVSEQVTAVAESVAGSDVGPTFSEYDAFDEHRYYVDEGLVLGTPGAVTEEAREVQEALGDVAAAMQRIAVCGLHKQYAKGRMHDHPDYSGPVEVPQKFFRVEGFMTMSALGDAQLYDALDAGVVVTRLGAATGMGKTRKLPGMIASRCGLRVLQLEPDNVIAADAMRAQAKEYNIRASAKSWSREKRAYLSVMSYHDFRGIVCSGGRGRLFEDFDVIYMDEAHLPLAVIYSAKQYFAAYSRPHNSLIIASATVSTEEGNNMTAHAVGRFEVSTVPVSLSDAMDSGVLVSRHLRDRMMVIVASDEQVASARSYFEQEGLDVSVLDSGSVEGDVKRVVSKFVQPSAAVPRVLVADERHGTAYNIPVSYVITTATVRVYELGEGNALVEKEIPVMEKVVTQHKGRTGRGMVTGSGGWVMSAARAVEKELLPSEALEAYLSLVAAGIKPRPGMFDSVTRVLPRGINRDVAKLLLRSTLPAALVVRYLGSDGRFAARFCKGVELFMQQGEPVSPSRDPYPVGYDMWIEEQVGEYYEGDDSFVSSELRVPFKSPKGLKVAMHTISAIEKGLLTVPRWSMTVFDEHSDDETVGTRNKVKRARKILPRVVENEVLPDVQESTVTLEDWQYNVDPSTARGRRRRQAMSWEPNGDGSGAVKVLLKSLRDGNVGRSTVVPQVGAPEYVDRVAYGLPLVDEKDVAIDSPGGGRVLLVTSTVHEKWMSGSPLDPDEFVAVLSHIRQDRIGKRFAMATLFDNWSPAWLSWFGGYADLQGMEKVKLQGLHKVAIDLLGFLYDRFKAEVHTVVNSSAVYSDTLRGFFRKTPSLTKFAKAVKKGNIPIAQSDKFLARLLEIKEAHDVAVMAIEEVGLFAPHSVTVAQQRLPLRDKGRNMSVIDASVIAVPGKVVSNRTEKWRE